MRMTAKVKAAIAQSNKLGLPTPDDAEAIYSNLDEAGYKWDSQAKQWIERPGIDPFFSTGVLDIRLRTGNADIVRVSEQVMMACESLGMIVIKEPTKFHPDDRYGEAKTSRSYIQVKFK